MAKDMNKKGMFKTFDDWANRTTMHGMSAVASAVSFKAKLVWSGVCVASMAMFVYMLSRLIMQYLEFGVNVRIEEVSASAYTLNILGFSKLIKVNQNP